VGDEAVPRSPSEGRSHHHVERVIARILAKRRAAARFDREAEPENTDTDDRW
jgi:hypothetical protein